MSEESERKMDKLVMDIVSGKKKSVNVKGYIYDVVIDESEEEVWLEPHGSGDRVTSMMGGDDYGYTHGGRVMKAAQELAWEIEAAWRKDRAKDSDI